MKIMTAEELRTRLKITKDWDKRIEKAIKSNDLCPGIYFTREEIMRAGGFNRFFEYLIRQNLNIEDIYEDVYEDEYTFRRNRYEIVINNEHRSKNNE